MTDQRATALRRARPRPLPAPTIDLGEIRERIADLTLNEQAVFWLLIDSYWRNGELPTDEHRLAAIPKVSLQRWRRMAPALEAVFDVDANGRWRDFELEDQRAAAAAISANRARAGRESAERRRTLRLVDTPNLVPSDLPENVVEGIAGVPTPVATGVGTPADETSPRMGGAEATGVATRLAARGSIDQSISGEPDKSIDRSIRARDASEIAAPDATGVEAGEPQLGIGSTVDVVIGAGAGVPTPVATGVGTPGPSLDLAPVPKVLDDARILDALHSTCGSLKAKDGGPAVKAGAYTTEGARKVYELIEDGFDLDREILPFFQRRLPTMRTALKFFGASFIREQLPAFREELAEEARVAEPNGTAATYWVEKDTPQWHAWLAHKGVRSMVMVDRPGHTRPGFYMPSEWPPGADPAAPPERSRRRSNGHAPGVHAPAEVHAGPSG